MFLLLHSSYRLHKTWLLESDPNHVFSLISIKNYTIKSQCVPAIYFYATQVYLLIELFIFVGQMAW